MVVDAVGLVAAELGYKLRACAETSCRHGSNRKRREEKVVADSPSYTVLMSSSSARSAQDNGLAEV